MSKTALSYLKLSLQTLALAIEELEAGDEKAVAAGPKRNLTYIAPKPKVRKPLRSNTSWAPEEIKLLVSERLAGKSFMEIAKKLRGRNHMGCYHKYRSLSEENSELQDAMGVEQED